MDRRDFVKLGASGLLATFLPDPGDRKAKITFDGIMAVDKNKLLGVLPVPGHFPKLEVFQAGKRVYLTNNLADLEIDCGLPYMRDFYPAEPLSKGIDFNQLYPNQTLSLDKVEGMQFLKLPFGNWGCERWSGQTWAFHHGDQIAATKKIYKFYCEVLLNGQDLVIGKAGQRRKFRLGSEGGDIEIAISNIPKDLASASPDHFAHYYEIIKEKIPQFVPSLLSASYAPFPRFCEPVLFTASAFPLP